jgi:hypothetical protein
MLPWAWHDDASINIAKPIMHACSRKAFDIESRLASGAVLYAVADPVSMLSGKPHQEMLASLGAKRRAHSRKGESTCACVQSNTAADGEAVSW